MDGLWDCASGIQETRTGGFGTCGDLTYPPKLAFAAEEPHHMHSFVSLGSPLESPLLAEVVASGNFSISGISSFYPSGLALCGGFYFRERERFLTFLSGSVNVQEALFSEVFRFFILFRTAPPLILKCFRMV